MTITTKFNYGDEVWFMQDDKPIKDKIREFMIKCEYSGGSANGWNNATYPIVIKYRFTDKSKKLIFKHESECFPSKEALIASL